MARSLPQFAETSMRAQWSQDADSVVCLRGGRPQTDSDWPMLSARAGRTRVSLPWRAAVHSRYSALIVGAGERRRTLPSAERS